MTHGENVALSNPGEGWKTLIRHNLFGYAPEKLGALFDKVYDAAAGSDTIPDGLVTSALLDLQGRGELTIFTQTVNTSDGAQEVAYVQRCVQQQLAS